MGCKLSELSQKRDQDTLPLRSVQETERKAAAAVLPLADETFDRKVFSLLGVPIDALTMAQTTTAIDRTINSGGKMWLSTPNLDWIHMARNDADFRRTTIAADLSVCDGMPVLLLAKIAGIPLKTRVQGSSLFDRLRKTKPSFRGSRSVFFFGGREGAAEKAAAALTHEDGGVTSIGSFNPGFGTVDQMSAPEIVDEVSAGNPDLLIVSLSSRKGQLWIEQNFERLAARIIAPLGAVVDFTSGTIQRAPKLLQRLGLEWLWRIKEDPKLALRYGQNLLALPGFATRCMLIRTLLGRKNSKGVKSETMSQIQPQAGQVVVHLGADCREAALTPTREALKAAIAANLDVHVDFAAADCIDLSLMGLLQLAAHRTEQSGHKFTIGGTDKTSRLIMALNDCRFQDKVLAKDASGDNMTGQVSQVSFNGTRR